MFGVATNVERMLDHLPLWQHWYPDGPDPTPLVLILSGHLSDAEKRTATDLAIASEDAGLHMLLKVREAERVEKRYFMLAEEMWDAAITRELDEGIITEWFVFSSVPLSFVFRNHHSTVSGYG